MVPSEEDITSRISYLFYGCNIDIGRYEIVNNGGISDQKVYDDFNLLVNGDLK